MKREQIIEIFKWLLGYYNFPERKEGDGAYWWRRELRRRLAAIGFSNELLSKETIPSSIPEKNDKLIIEKQKQIISLLKKRVDEDFNPSFWTQLSKMESELANLEKQGEKEEIIKGSSGEVIEEIPSFTSTKYSYQPQTNKKKTDRQKKPQINDYPSTDERTYLELDGNINWAKYANALDKYIFALEQGEQKEDEELIKVFAKGYRKGLKQGYKDGFEVDKSGL